MSRHTGLLALLLCALVAAAVGAATKEGLVRLCFFVSFWSKNENACRMCERAFILWLAPPPLFGSPAASPAHS
jgi:hypothetical protein